MPRYTTGPSFIMITYPFSSLLALLRFAIKKRPLWRLAVDATSKRDLLVCSCSCSRSCSGALLSSTHERETLTRLNRAEQLTASCQRALREPVWWHVLSRSFPACNATTGLQCLTTCWSGSIGSSSD